MYSRVYDHGIGLHFAPGQYPMKSAAEHLRLIEQSRAVVDAHLREAAQWRGQLRRELRGVRAMIETYPLDQAPEAYARMMSGQAEFRVVLTM